MYVVATHRQWQCMLCEVMCCPLYPKQNTAEERELLMACWTGNLETVRRLAEEVDPTRVKDFSNFEWSPLHYAAT